MKLALILLSSSIFLSSCATNPSSKQYVKKDYHLKNPTKIMINGKASSEKKIRGLTMNIVFNEYFQFESQNNQEYYQSFLVKIKNKSKKRITISNDMFTLSGTSVLDPKKNVIYNRKAQSINGQELSKLIDDELKKIWDEHHDGFKIFGDFLNLVSGKKETKEEEYNEKERELIYKEEVQKLKNDKILISGFLSTETLNKGETQTFEIAFPVLKGVRVQALKFEFSDEFVEFYMDQN